VEPNRKYEQQIQQLIDIHQIQNLMSRYEYVHVAGPHPEEADLFAQRTPDVKLEIANLGVWDGIESIRRWYKGNSDHADKHGRIGQLHLHTLTTPVIEVAGDGKTAQGVWISPGVETGPMPGSSEVLAAWQWVKYGVDFIIEDGEWKIWHFHIYRIFFASYNKSWAEGPQRPSFVTLPDEIKPNRPPTYEWQYSPQVAPENVPAPPTPYETWDDSRSYVK
jgi:hypothetical protein